MGESGQTPSLSVGFEREALVCSMHQSLVVLILWFRAGRPSGAFKKCETGFSNPISGGITLPFQSDWMVVVCWRNGFV